MSRSVSSSEPSTVKRFILKALFAASIAASAVLGHATGAAADARNPRFAGIVVDAHTGNVLFSDNADRLQYPASLTKMMTLYLTFEALERGRIRLDTPVTFSAHASSEPPTKLGVRPGGTISVEQAILGLITLSANDAATALGELIGGSEDRFAQMMTAKAHALGMTRTTYRNANGLPNTAQMTTARDQARLGIALRQHYPQYFGYFATQSFKFGNRTIFSHNRLVGSVQGVDGIKTGYTRAAGYNLVTSLQTGGRSVVGVVLGGSSGAARDSQMRSLLAKFLPKASVGRGKDALAEGNPLVKLRIPVAAAKPGEADVQVASAGAAPIAAEAPAPAAAVAPQEATRVVAAYASERMGATLPAPARVKTQSFRADGSAAIEAAPSPASSPASAAASEVAAYMPAGAAEGGLDSLTTGSTGSDPMPEGWMIQVGVTPTREAALDMLKSIQAKGGRLLGDAKPVTLANAGGYRARFAGFADQSEAVNACKALKRSGVQCWASSK